MGKNEKGSVEDTDTSKADNKREKIRNDSKDTKFSHMAEATASKMKGSEKSTSDSNIDDNTEEGLPDSFRVTKESLSHSNFPTQNSRVIDNDRSGAQDQTGRQKRENLILSEHSKDDIDKYATSSGLDQPKEKDPVEVEVVTITEHKSNDPNADNQGSSPQIGTLNNLEKDTMKLEEDNTITTKAIQSSSRQPTEAHKWEQKILIPVHNNMTDVEVQSSSNQAFVWSKDINLIKMEDNHEQRNEVCVSCGHSGDQSETKIYAGEEKDKNELSEINKNAMNVKNENINYADELTTADNATRNDWKNNEMSQEKLLSSEKHLFKHTGKVEDEPSDQRENVSALESLNVRNEEFVDNKLSPETVKQSTSKSIHENSQSVVNKLSNVKYSVSDENKSDVTLDKVIKNVIKGRTTDESETKKRADSKNGNKTKAGKAERESVLGDNIESIEKYLRQEVSDITFEEAAKNDTTKLKEGKNQYKGEHFEINSSDIQLGKELKNRPKNDTKDVRKIGPAMKNKNEDMAKNVGNGSTSRYTELIKLRQDMKEKNDMKSSSLGHQQTKVFSQEKDMKSMKSMKSHKSSVSNEKDKTDTHSPKISNKIIESKAIWKIADNVKNIKDELFDVKHNDSVKDVNVEKKIPHSSLNSQLSQASTQKSTPIPEPTNLSKENVQPNDIGNFRKKALEMPLNTETDEKNKLSSKHLGTGLYNRNEQVHIQPRFPIATINKIYLGKQAYSFPPKPEEIPLPWSSHNVPKDHDIYNDISEKSSENDHRTAGNFGQFFARQSAAFKENFNNNTIRGRANVAKATLLAVGLFTVWQIFKPKKHDLMLQKCPDCGSKNAM